MNNQNDIHLTRNSVNRIPYRRQGVTGPRVGRPQFAKRIKSGSYGPQCPSCGHQKSLVIDSRLSGGTCRRRRCCAKCETRFTTYELVAVEQQLDYQI
jgi:hypothetical protein